MAKILYPFFRFIASFLAFFLMLGSANPGKMHTVKNEETNIMNFTVLSDVHMETNNKTSRDAFIRIMYDVKNNNAGCDALVLLGDNTMNGQMLENAFVYGIMDKIKPAAAFYTAMGNHDSGNGIGDYNTRSQRFIDFYNAFNNDNISSTYYYKTVEGYYFIFLGSEEDAVNTSKISVEQMNWLNALLDEATIDGKPAFVFNHHPYNYMDENNELMYKILTSHKNVFYFSGHTHTWTPVVYDIADSVHFFNLPRCTEQNDDGTLKDDVCGLGFQVEIYDGVVSVRQRNFYKSEWITDYDFNIV